MRKLISALTIILVMGFNGCIQNDVDDIKKNSQQSIVEVLAISQLQGVYQGAYNASLKLLEQNDFALYRSMVMMDGRLAIVPTTAIAEKIATDIYVEQKKIMEGLEDGE